MDQGGPGRRVLLAAGKLGGFAVSVFFMRMRPGRSTTRGDLRQPARGVPRRAEGDVLRHVMCGQQRSRSGTSCRYSVVRSKEGDVSSPEQDLAFSGGM